jgi:hypothetical protein
VTATAAIRYYHVRAACSVRNRLGICFESAILTLARLDQIALHIRVLPLWVYSWTWRFSFVNAASTDCRVGLKLQRLAPDIITGGYRMEDQVTAD